MKRKGFCCQCWRFESMIGWCWYFELVIRQHILVGMCVDAKSCSFLCIEICLSKLICICNFDSASQRGGATQIDINARNTPSKQLPIKEPESRTRTSSNAALDFTQKYIQQEFLLNLSHAKSFQALETAQQFKVISLLVYGTYI